MTLCSFFGKGLRSGVERPLSNLYSIMLTCEYEQGVVGFVLIPSSLIYFHFLCIICINLFICIYSFI